MSLGVEGFNWFGHVHCSKCLVSVGASFASNRLRPWLCISCIDILEHCFSELVLETICGSEGNVSKEFQQDDEDAGVEAARSSSLW